MKDLFKEKNIHLIFEVSLIGKGILALFAIIGGILVYFLTQQCTECGVYYHAERT